MPRMNSSEENRTNEDSAASAPEIALPPLCRIQHILTVVPIARSTIWLWARQGRFPAPIKRGAITVWKRDEVLEWLLHFGEAK